MSELSVVLSQPPAAAQHTDKALDWIAGVAATKSFLPEELSYWTNWLIICCYNGVPRSTAQQMRSVFAPEAVKKARQEMEPPVNGEGGRLPGKIIKGAMLNAAAHLNWAPALITRSSNTSPEYPILDPVPWHLGLATIRGRVLGWVQCFYVSSYSGLSKEWS